MLHPSAKKNAENIFSSAGLPFTETPAKSAASLCCCHTGNVQRLPPARGTVHARPFHYVCRAALRLRSRPTPLPGLPVSPALWPTPLRAPSAGTAGEDRRPRTVRWLHGVTAAASVYAPPVNYKRYHCRWSWREGGRGCLYSRGLFFATELK